LTDQLTRDIFRSLSVGLIILEAAANVVLPDNGPAWHKLRSNDFSDVDLSRLSHELAVLLAAMLEKSPDERISVDDVITHPILARLSDLLEASLKIEDDSAERRVSIDLGEERPLLGAILPEEEGFLFELFSSVYNYEGDVSVEIDGGETDDERDSMEID
jgi:serine/threonine protein kinase